MSAVFSRSPWGRNECVTNEPQKTSAGRLVPLKIPYEKCIKDFQSSQNGFIILKITAIIFSYQQVSGFRQQNVNILKSKPSSWTSLIRTFVSVNQLCGLENSFVSLPIACQRINKQIQQIALSLLSQTIQTKLDECGVLTNKSVCFSVPRVKRILQLIATQTSLSTLLFG